MDDVCITPAGCSWDKNKQKLKESAPKEMVKELPVVHVTGIEASHRQAKKKGEMNKFKCPVYKYPSRNDINWIFDCDLNSEEEVFCPPLMTSLFTPSINCSIVDWYLRKSVSLHTNECYFNQILHLQICYCLELFRSACEVLISLSSRHACAHIHTYMDTETDRQAGGRAAR